MSLPTEKEFKDVQIGLKQKSDALIVRKIPQLSDDDKPAPFVHKGIAYFPYDRKPVRYL
jgi:hypothetical protein